MLYVQLAMIDAVCQWCVASDVVMNLLAAACALRMFSASRFGLSSGEADDPAVGVEIHAAS